ncbi:MAG TPA: cyclophilin-like fold protein [bacterium]|nr:cyclophilin-like fold protein [bacterium]
MKRILPLFVAGLVICALIVHSNASEDQTTMKISVKANGNTTVFQLNNSPAAKDLVAQLPLEITVEDYGDNEKIFYPPRKLNTADTPLAKNVDAGTLAYYAPWGDVVMFYKGFKPAPGLYELGNAISGEEHIRGMSGKLQIEKESLS